MKQAAYKRKLIKERGKDFYNENKSLLAAQYEYIESLGDIDDITSSENKSGTLNLE